mgnify:CR=1 FL=1
MYIGQANIDLINHNIFEKVFSIKKGERFIAKDGILHNDIKAKNVKILKCITSRKDTELEDYLVLENKDNSEWIDIELNGEDPASYEKLKKEKEELEKKLEEKEAESERTEETEDSKKNSENKKVKETKKNSA